MAAAPQYSPFPTDLVPITTAAKLSGWTAKSLYHWIRTNQLTAYGRPGAIRVSISEVFKPLDPKTIKPRGGRYKQKLMRLAKEKEQGAQTPTCVKTDTVCLVNDSPVSDENTVQSSDKHAR